MAIGDVNSIVRAYLVTQTALTALIGGSSTPRVYCPSVPQGGTFPAISYFRRGGVSNDYYPGIVDPSFQFDCWGNDSITAESIYTKLYDALQGIENIPVVVGSKTYHILGAKEETMGTGPLRDVDDPNKFRVIAFFSIKILAE